MTAPWWAWAATILIIVILVVIDLLAFSRHPHHVRLGEAARWSGFYIAVAIAFGLVVSATAGHDWGTQFFTAYLVEESLSVDNLFVFAIILARFQVPVGLHQRVLLIGVLLALVFRAVFILVGAAAIQAFAVTFVIFGALLIWTGIQLGRHWDEDPEPSDNFAIRAVRRILPLSDEFAGKKMLVRIDGQLLGTPLLLVTIAIGSTDVLFALDSIPATFGVTQIAFLVFAANAFALMGLRALFFLLKGLLDRLVYLSLGLAVILVFIGVKLVLAFVSTQWHVVPHIPTTASLAVIVVVLGVTTLASLARTRVDPTARAHAGVVLESHAAPHEGVRPPDDQTQEAPPAADEP